MHQATFPAQTTSHPQVVVVPRPLNPASNHLFISAVRTATSIAAVLVASKDTVTPGISVPIVLWANTKSMESAVIIPRKRIVQALVVEKGPIVVPVIVVPLGRSMMLRKGCVVSLDSCVVRMVRLFKRIYLGIRFVVMMGSVFVMLEGVVVVLVWERVVVSGRRRCVMEFASLQAKFVDVDRPCPVLFARAN